jgi:hypothetical protein
MHLSLSNTVYSLWITFFIVLLNTYVKTQSHYIHIHVCKLMPIYYMFNGLSCAKFLWRWTLSEKRKYFALVLKRMTVCTRNTLMVKMLLVYFANILIAQKFCYSGMMSIILVNPAVVDQGSVNCLDPEPVGSKRKCMCGKGGKALLWGPCLLIPDSVSEGIQRV